MEEEKKNHVFKFSGVERSKLFNFHFKMGKDAHIKLTLRSRFITKNKTLQFFFKLWIIPLQLGFMCGDTRVEGEQNLTTKTKLYRFDYDPRFFLKIFFFFFQEKDFTVARVLWVFFSSRAPGDPRKEKKNSRNKARKRQQIKMDV